METTFSIWVGIDWATVAHQVCVLTDERTLVLERAVAHRGAELACFVEQLVTLAGGEPHRIAVAIETPHGAIVDTLLDRGIAVFAINPKQLDRFRDRHTVAGAKDDRRDAFVLAHSLRTDLPLFRRVQLGDPLVVQMRELVRIHAELTQEHSAVANRLWDQVHRFYPQILELGTLHDEPWLWALLELAPTPAQAQALTPSRLATLLKEHRIRRLEATRVLEALRAVPLHVAPGVTDAACTHVAFLLPQLRLVHQQQQECLRKLESLYAAMCLAPGDGPPERRREPSDAAILRSVPGVGILTCATMLAEATQPLAARDYRTLRSLAGVAPVTKSSGTAGRKGKPRRNQAVPVGMRHACNELLRSAVYHGTRNAILRIPRFKEHYARLRAKAHSHGRAIRGVADRFLAMLVAMLKTRTLYDPARHVLPGAPAEATGSRQEVAAAA
jgi:transposase